MFKLEAGSEVVLLWQDCPTWWSGQVTGIAENGRIKVLLDNDETAKEFHPKRLRLVRNLLSLLVRKVFVHVRFFFSNDILLFLRKNNFSIFSKVFFLNIFSRSKTKQKIFFSKTKVNPFRKKNPK